MTAYNEYFHISTTLKHYMSIGLRPQGSDSNDSQLQLKSMTYWTFGISIWFPTNLHHIRIQEAKVRSLDSKMYSPESQLCVNTLRPRQNGQERATENFYMIFFNAGCFICNQISPKFVSASPMDNNLALVSIMACRKAGAKPLSDAILAPMD